MIEDSIYLVIYLFTELANYLLAYTVIFGSHITKRKERFFLVALILIIFHFELWQFVGIQGASSLSAFSMLVIPFLLLEPLEKKNFLLYPFVVFGTSIIGVSLSFIFSVIMNIPEYIMTEGNWYTILCQCGQGIILFILKMVKKYKKSESFEVYLDWKQYLLFYIVVICLFCIIAPLQAVTQGSLSSYQLNVLGAAASFACIVLVVVTIWQSVVVKREIQLKERNVLNEKILEMQKEHYEELLKQDEKMSRFRHDMKAHMTVLQSYCTEGENKEMQEYLDNVLQESAIYEVKEYTGNKGVDAIVRQLFDRAEQSQINIKLEGKLPENPIIKEYDLCTIVANLLKNAIEACEKINEYTKREVVMTTAFYNSQIYIIVKNTVAKDVLIQNNHLFTTKQDKKQHGIGTKNVELAIKKYNGELKYECKEGWFTAEVSI